MISTPIKFGIIGFGYIGKRHLETINTFAPAATVVAVADTDPTVKLNYIRENQAIRFYDSDDEFFNSETELDVICICTPNGLHAVQAIRALEKGCHVVIEKPMGLKRQECEAVLYTALQKNRQVFCVMQNRYSPPSIWLKEIISQNKLGNIYQVHINCFWNRDHRYYRTGSWKGSLALDGGPLFTQFSHFLDMMFWLFGDITDIQAQFANHNHQHNTEFEDSGEVIFRFLSGAQGSFHYSTSVWDKNLESSLTILGEKGAIKVSGQYMNEVIYCHIKDYTMPQLKPTNPANDYGYYKGSANNHSYVFQNVIETLAGRSTITTNALEGVKVVDIIERMYSAGNRPIKVHL
jgi:predicted dehydrogenase